jgi:hypothetical protein
LSTAGKLLENKAVDFQLLTIRDGRKNKRISFFLLDNSKGQNLQRDKTSSQETGGKKKEKKTGIKDLECTPT